MTFQPRHLLVAAALHLLLFGLMAGGVQCTRKIPPPMVMEAVLYDPSRQQVADRKKGDEQRRKREADEKKRKQVKLEEEALQREQQEKKRAAEEQARKKAEEQETKKKADEQAKRKAEQDRLKKEQQEKRERQEQEKRATEMKSQMQREIEQENLRRQMDQEASALRESEIKGKTSEWAATVTRHIQKNWIRPGASDADFNCAVQVQLLPDGSVTTARIVRSCGSAVLNKSVEDAVYRSSPIPRPSDPAVFTRDLTINFVPQ